MLYAALTFWLFVVIFAAWGVHHLWSSLLRPRVVNSLLLPGTLIAQLGHILGLLVTGGSVRNATLIGDGKDGAPRTDAAEPTRLPIIGPILVGLLPLLACGTGLYAASRYWGGGVLGHLTETAALALPQALPTSLAGVWDLLRRAIDLIELVFAAIAHSNWFDLSTLLFLYLAVCLTVRMAPLEGNRRGTIGAIVLAGLAVALMALLSGSTQQAVLTSWPILSFAVGMLLFLLVLSLAVSGLVGLFRILAGNDSPR